MGLAQQALACGCVSYVRRLTIPDYVQVLHGHGLLGREDGLYGAVSFAYQG